MGYNIVYGLINFAILADCNFQPVGQCVYNRRTYSVKTAGYLISSAAEFSAGMQYRKYNFYSRKTSLRVDANRNTASIICYRHGIISVDDYFYIVTEARKSLIDCIIYNFINKMMKTSL